MFFATLSKPSAQHPAMASKHLPDLGEHELMSPDLSLASEAVGSDEAQPKRAQINNQGWKGKRLTR